MALRIGVIGGTGMYDWGPGQAVDVETEFGLVPLTYHKRPKGEVFFLARHGRDHVVPAHRVDSRIHVRALEAAHADYLVSFYNAGALEARVPSGSWLVLDDLVDLTHGRPRTFHDGDAFHVDLARPFCPQLRAALHSSAPPHARTGGTYATTDGPRFETAAEARMLRASGADVVGMTAGPEVALAREAGICTAGIAFVANAAGRPAPPAREVQRRFARAVPTARSWIDRAFAALPARKRCDCAAAARGASLAVARGRAR